MKNVLVIGSNGMLGYAVSEYFCSKGYSVEAITRNEFDIASEPFEKLIPKLISCDVIINCSGVIKPRIEAMSFEDVLKVNSLFPHNLARYCLYNSKMCFHITTDCVYSGKKGKYSEFDLFDADDIYGISKKAGEPNECMVLRTSIIGEEFGEGRSLLEWAISQKGKDVNGFTNHLWNGLTTVYLAEVIEKIILEDLYSVGMFHVYSPQPVTKYELLQTFNEIYNLNLNISATEASTKCDRSLFSMFEVSEKLIKKSIPVQVKEMKIFFELLKTTV